MVTYPMAVMARMDNKLFLVPLVLFRTFHFSITLCYQGPNFIWHMDGYDKLKPYGITIHGCIDG